jgi:hypothetical protein
MKAEQNFKHERSIFPFRRVPSPGMSRHAILLKFTVVSRGAIAFNFRMKPTTAASFYWTARRHIPKDSILVGPNQHLYCVLLQLQGRPPRVAGRPVGVRGRVQQPRPNVGTHPEPRAGPQHQHESRSLLSRVTPAAHTRLGRGADPEASRGS